MNVKIILAILMVLAVFWLILTNPNDFIEQANLAAEEAVEDVETVYDIGHEVLGLRDDTERQEMRQEHILKEVKKMKK